MSHLHGRALTEKQNVLHVFSKHFKSTDKTCSPTNRSTPHCCSSSHTKNTEAQNSQTNKTKRLKTRKQRSQVSRGGSNSRSHQHQSSKEKDHCHGCCQSSSRPPPRRDAPLARVFPAGQEPSIITNNRLIGHHGLFNHEVKSIDIERLLSEQRKLEKLGQRGGRARGGSSESSDNQMQQTVTNPVSVVAARLCRSLQLPLLRRRNLVAESREVLLQALRERHGLQLQENLLNVQRRLSFGTGPTTTRAGLGQSTILAGVDAYGGWPAAPLDSGFGDSMVEQTCLDSQRSAPNKRRRRKQLCPNRMTPPQPLIGSQNSLDTAAAWNPNPSVEQVGELIGELLRPASSSHFLMDLQPSGSPSRHHVFDPPPASPWAAQSGLPQPWDDVFDRGSMRESTRVDHFENWRSHLPDMAYYPPSHMLESGLSPPLPPVSLPAFPSPECWSFPRMRLY
ncbi:proline-rich protein 19 [Salvelinus namaycush]|uniref:Proline-rich protein 19 n=1 Tax=Salvelinus namaycush TaxID=8040 RepID=A0A8U0UE09_SALNM|nr:proline-rich protein 19 [Salvelinus namaycush]